MQDILPELNNKEYILALDREYDIHFWLKEEVDQLVRFLDRYWRKDHIFVLSRSLLDWQHYNKRCDRYNFVIAKHRKSGEIHSILGFVPTSQFDENIKRIEVWPCIWKARKDVRVKGLGVALYYFLKENLSVETISILGISEEALSIYKHWNFTTGKMQHWFMLNSEKDVFQIIQGSVECREKSIRKEIARDCRFEKCSLKEYMEIPEESLIFSNISRYKSKIYYVNRFYFHPIYTYKIWKIINQNKLKGIMVTRECCHQNARCLRIVDYIGSFAEIQMEAMQKILIDNNYEYIDFLVNGIDENVLKKAGFLNREKVPGIVVPNYFEPFCAQNIELDWAFKTVEEDLESIFYKADADQDRPNVLENYLL